MKKKPDMAVIMSDPNRAAGFFASMPEEFWLQEGSKKAVETFQETARLVPVYKSFLKNNSINPKLINSPDDFRQVPLVSKETYLTKFPLDRLCIGGRLGGMYSISRSSGHNGSARYWPRFKKQDDNLPIAFELMYQYYNILTVPTLVIINFAMGTWIAGEVCAWATREIAKKDGYPLSVMQPGTNVRETVEIVRDIGKYFKQIIFFGYPPTIRNIIYEGEENGLKWERYNTKIMTGGEPISEIWRSHIRERIGSKKLTDIISVFGSSEGSMIGFETPFCILARKLVSERPEIGEALFGTRAPESLIQFNPMTRWIESVDGELVLTVSGGLPLVRYNTHDLGGFMRFSEFIDRFKSFGYNLEELVIQQGFDETRLWKWPLFYSLGRGGGSVTIVGANIYPSNLTPFFHSSMAKEANSFQLGVEHDEFQNARLTIYIELRNSFKLNKNVLKNLLQKYHDGTLNQLLSINSDFQDAHNSNPSSTDPDIKFYEFGQGPFLPTGRIKRSYVRT